MVFFSIRQISPYKAWLELFSTDSGGTTKVAFMKSGAVAPDLDLSSLSPGPLKTYLDRLQDWNSVANAISGSRVLFRVITSGGAGMLSPLLNFSAVGVSMILTPGNQTSIDFGFGANPQVVPDANSLVRLEMAFLHSSGR
jgi:hypothetical protein